MSEQIADRFIEALHRLETHDDPDPIVALFADDCELANVTGSGASRGREAARKFWQQDRLLSGDVRSEFRAVIASDDGAALEWTRRGTAPDGTAVEYPGVSVLEIRDGSVSRFMAYFDPAVLGTPS